MKRITLLLALAAICTSEAEPSYTLAVPGAPVIRYCQADPTDATKNEWLASNAVASVSASLSPFSAVPGVSAAVTPGVPVYSIPSSIAGFPVERIQPSLWLADALPVPDGVDWVATYNFYTNSVEETGNFIFDNKQPAVYTQAGGNLTFSWVMLSGATNEQTYIVSGNVRGRPYRMFWTEPPWNAPEISLAGKFVKLYGPDYLIKPEFGTRERVISGQKIVETNVVVKGVYFDQESGSLSAWGGVSGQFILAYYDSGSFTTLKHLEVIEVGEPTVQEMTARIGEPIIPYGTGYNPEGLVPSPIANETAATDEFGDYYYQHAGQHSYSPKNGKVFPLRDTSDAPWRIDVYWMESDPYGVQWPFERCQYAASWSRTPAVLIAGDRVKIPSDYQAKLLKFQIPNGHARAPENNVFTATAPGLSCLQLSLADDVFFQTVRTVERTDTNCFTLAESPWFVGSEITPRRGADSGLVDGFAPEIDYDVPGFLDIAHSGNNYNPNIYYDWTSASNDFASAIYPVNASSGDAIEVHWYSSFKQDGMPSKISFPSVLQRYSIVWPAPNQLPQIVIASGKGGAADSIYETGNAMSLPDADSRLSIPNTRCFNESGGAVAFWVDATDISSPTGRVLTLGTESKNTLRLRVDATAEEGELVRYKFGLDHGTKYNFVSSGSLRRSGWHRLVYVFSPTNHVLYVDGRRASSDWWRAVDVDYSQFMVGSSVGKAPGAPAMPGLKIDGLQILTTQPTADAVMQDLYSAEEIPNFTKMMLFPFPDGDLESVSGSDISYATEVVSGSQCEAVKVKRATPGAPTIGSGLFEADAVPRIYRQNAKGQTGYNPNEEHAFIGLAGGNYYAWALRCDLNTEETSRPFTLVEYEKGGEKKMKAFSVVLTNDTYKALAGTATAGTILPGPHPLDLFDNPWLTNDWWEVTAGTPTIAWPDRKNQIWTRAAGTLDIHMFYPNQQGFDYPSLAANPPVGTPIPWLASLDGDDVLTGNPAPWHWDVEWPANVPMMRIGQTLTTASAGLPEVWNAKSMAVVWPDDGGKTALLWDPTAVRNAGDGSYATPADLLAAFGFDPAAGNVTLRAGKYTFSDLPPSISDRFYVNANLATDKCLSFEGRMETNAGGSILWPNALNNAEKDAIKDLVKPGDSKKSQWDALVGKLPTVRIEPSRLGWSQADTNKPAVVYSPRDHYAITAMGATNYVTIIENDSPVGGANGIKDGDQISMHVFAVTNQYYAGRVVTREDPLNLLSQQLGIIYTEAFAGAADDFVFEWKKAKPHDDGSMPKDYTNEYDQVFEPSAGLTRFTIGQQGDTLANLVNTYYVMRYRAKGNTYAHNVMGDRWSDWCGPALAEGWIQRCVNNITPFTQRVTDLYSGAAETMSTMLMEAGKPWTGDVALNQDNLAKVGLVELYQTLLNKAESMSLTLGLNDTDANKQLMLAAERLADLYMILGDEAYADALNPTIGFGATFGESSARGDDIDYGAESTGLFCFDNQVPSLLDEELALLRGRTGVNNPSVTTAPFYNRLVWNFTRGITAGEVAYAMNYDIYSHNGDANIDEDDAALQYPQGHGDALGHYLSALSVWYRLLRNPYFSWSTSQMQMNVADNVVDVDYYDEERLADIASRLAKTTDAVVDRTIRKAWRENGGAPGAGYLDSDSERAFGYGEAATRGGIGAMMNWMVANSMLPAAEDSGDFWRLRFYGDDYIYMTNAPISTVSSPWTFEFQVRTDGERPAGAILEIFGDQIDVMPHPAADSGDIYSTMDCIVLSGTENGLVAKTLRFNNYLVSVTETRTVSVTTTNDLGVVSTEESEAEFLTYQLRSETEELFTSEPFECGSDALIAISSDKDSNFTLRAFDANGASVAGIDVGKVNLGNDDIVLLMGDGFSGYLSELRLWSGDRQDSDLVASRNFVNPRLNSLRAYSRGISDAAGSAELVDETPSSDCPWMVALGEWVHVPASGFDVAFDDDGLLRINRATATSLEELAQAQSDIQRRLDGADAGLNPLGLASSAIPFDIAPGDGEGDGDDAASHFEQIAARATTALSNAAKVLDRAQEASQHLRQVTNLELNEEEQASEAELSFNSALIEIYGTPYADDIGPAGTYPQGYDGPDLYHYMYMDLDAFGLTDRTDTEPVAIVTYDGAKGGWTYEALKQFANSTTNSVAPTNSSTKTYSYQISASGLVVKPSSFTGKRQSAGKIQEAYTDYILARIAWKNAMQVYNGKYDTLRTRAAWVESAFTAASTLHDKTGDSITSKYVTDALQTVFDDLKITFGAMKDIAEDADAYSEGISSMTMIGIGLSSIFVPGAVSYAVAGGLGLSIKSGAVAASSIAEGLSRQTAYAQSVVDNIAAAAENAANWTDAQKTAFDEMMDLIGELGEASREVGAAWAEMVAAAENFDSVVAEGDRLQAERQASRARLANRIDRLRYNDMFFRNVRDFALTRYQAAFDLAQKYVFMAAQVYDYETGMLSADTASGSRFIGEIVGARAIGKLDDGDVVLGGGYGDAGLSDILARMKANYAVLKPRLGINNPERNATWFSMRTELFRISSATNSDSAWRKELSKYIVKDLRSVPEYKRFCQSVSSTTGLNQAEPALVIPFSSTIDFGKNFFGRELEAGDHSLDSSYYATKISSAGVKFEGYPADALASNPVCYLVPAGTDSMRVPGGGENGTVLAFNIMDQVIPAPFQIGSTQLDDDMWMPSDSLGGANAASNVKIRRIPSFRAMTGDDDVDDRSSKRLFGRSAWNTRWVLIVPAGAMLGGSAENREAALRAFIYGADSDNDGTIDVSGVSDILIGLRTFSHSGN